MKSVECHFTSRDLVRCIVPTVLVILCLVVMIRLSHKLGLLPLAPVSLDPDTTILAHQALASRARGPAELVLLGDSTCLLGVDALGLSRGLPGQPRALSLALFIWLDLNTYAEALSDFATANPGQIRCVVLLLTPLKLAHPTRDDGSALKEWRRMRQNLQLTTSEPEAPSWKDWFGIRLLQQRVLSRLLAHPLRGNGAMFFGFSSDIDAYMSEHHGSLIDFGTALSGPSIPSVPTGHWELAPEFEAESRAFRAKVPRGAKLCIGLTPSVSNVNSEELRRQRDDLLHRWDRWIQADALLTNLPPALPTLFFSRTAHLNELGQKRFTDSLSRELAPLLSR
jgi:hypothetical protein